MIVGCPKCKTGRLVGKNWYSSICSVCGKYFSENTALKEDECETMVNTNVPINTVFTTAKAEMEKKAYAYKENVMDKKKAGNYISHEPRN